MRISTIDFTAAEEEMLRALATKHGHAENTLSPANLIRAALGFELRRRGGPREMPKKKPATLSKKKQKGYIPPVTD